MGSVRSSRRHCNSGVKDGVAAPPVGTRVSCFERSLLEPNSAWLSPGPEGNIITQLIPGQRSPRVFPGPGRGHSPYTTDPYGIRPKLVLTYVLRDTFQHNSLCPCPTTQGLQSVNVSTHLSAS